MIITPFNRRGSIMIWTLLLGITLTTVFFFFSQRLNFSAVQQRKTIEYQNAKMFLDSYADYLETLDSGELKTIRDTGAISFEGITGTVTNAVNAITGVLDEGDTVKYVISLPELTDKITVSWNLCANDEAGRVFLSDDFDNPITTECNVPGVTYEGTAELTKTPFELSAPMAPVSYKILPLGKAVLYDNYWTADLEISIGLRKKVKVERIFTPGS